MRRKLSDVEFWEKAKQIIPTERLNRGAKFISAPFMWKNNTFGFWYDELKKGVYVQLLDSRGNVKDEFVYEFKSSMLEEVKTRFENSTDNHQGTSKIQIPIDEFPKYFVMWDFINPNKTPSYDINAVNKVKTLLEPIVKELNPDSNDVKAISYILFKYVQNNS